MNDIQVERVGFDQAGCWVEGSRGWYAQPLVVRIAIGRGMEVSEADLSVLSRYECGDHELDAMETVSDLVDDAEAWLNEHVAAEGYSFGWHDGEFFLWADADWQDNSF